MLNPQRLKTRFGDLAFPASASGTAHDPGWQREALSVLAAVLLAAVLAASGALEVVDGFLLQQVEGLAPGLGEPRRLDRLPAALASALLVLLATLLTRRFRTRVAMPLALLVPLLAVGAMLAHAGVWLGPMPALVAVKLPVLLRLFGQRQDALGALRRERDRALTVLETVREAVLGLDAGGRVRFANAAAADLLGLPPAGLVGRSWSDILPLREPADDRPLTALAHLAPAGPRLVLLVRPGRPVRELRLVTRALPRDDDARLLVALNDVTEISRLNASLLRHATHDTLTGLPNGDLAREHLHRALARTRRQDRTLAVLLLDLCGFKHVNDAFGREAGDGLLRAVGQRLAAACREQDLVARLGGDEFLCVAEGLASREASASFVGKLLAAFDAPFLAGGQELDVAPSVGVSLYPDDGRTREDLLRAADVALHAAKREGGRVRFFTADLDAAAQDQLRLRRSLQQALARGEFAVHYQLRVRLRDHAPAGFEALLRWRLAERGFVPPGLFVPIAESAGLIEPITRFVLHEAARQCRAWRRAGLEGATVAVNISARHLLHGDLAREVEAGLAKTGLDPAALTLELTEGTLVRDPSRAVEQLRPLKAMGVKVAVDDFGTGYSSLAYLRDLPIDTVKIDRAFVAELGRDRRHDAILAAIVKLAHGLGFATVAEGVETELQADHLRDLGCDEAQGFLFARPAPPESVTRVLDAVRAWRRLAPPARS